MISLHSFYCFIIASGRLAQGLTTFLFTCVDLSKILCGQTKILGKKCGKKWQMHGRFPIIEGTCPGCPLSLRLCFCYVLFLLHHSSKSRWQHAFQFQILSRRLDVGFYWSDGPLSTYMHTYIHAYILAYIGLHACIYSPLAFWACCIFFKHFIQDIAIPLFCWCTISLHQMLHENHFDLIMLAACHSVCLLVTK